MEVYCGIGNNPITTTTDGYPTVVIILRPNTVYQKIAFAYLVFNSPICRTPARFQDHRNARTPCKRSVRHTSDLLLVVVVDEFVSIAQWVAVGRDNVSLSGNTEKPVSIMR